ncbi:hypothetical protein GCM10023091_33260 [Ravibacter arvi]|uniref:Uncharacterized protein n=1 Tax=Ravibacter arvi TaxID=2051041 RepID=A0ABP8M6X6_9BACT
MVGYRAGEILPVVYFTFFAFFMQAFANLFGIYDPGRKGMGHFEGHPPGAETPFKMPSLGYAWL